jgi:uroporphyrinogen decarboxylase
MDHRERFFCTVAREPVDRPATWLGLPVPDSLPRLTNHFGVSDHKDLCRILGDDIFPVELPYHSPTSNAIYAAFDFALSGRGTEKNRTLTAPGFFAEVDDLDLVTNFPWPDPTLYIDGRDCHAIAKSAPDDCARLGMAWSAHFQDTCAAFGMESALMAMLENPEMFQAVIDKITEFYLVANEIFYESTRGCLDAVLIGNDFGSQTSLLLSPELIRKHVWPGTNKLIKQAKEYGLIVFHHSCGAIRELIPDLIEMGVDVIHPIQALASGMEPEGLLRDFGKKISFCGGIDAQELLVRGTPEAIIKKVDYLRELFPTGLILSPSHEAILPDIPPANIEAIFNAAHQISEKGLA